MIEYNEDCILKLLLRSKGSVAGRASVYAVPSALLALLLLILSDIFPTLREDLGLDILGNSQLWSASTSVLALLLGFRTNRAMARFWEGTGLLHQMRGEWFDSISCCVTFSRGAYKLDPEGVVNFRHTIVRLMSLCHGCALGEIGNFGEEVETIDSFGLDNQTLQHLKDCELQHHFDKVEVLLHMIQTLITTGLDDGVLKIPPPILSRVYQTLSKGFVNLLDAKKIADTRFPFPYAQTITALLFVNLVLAPAQIVCLVTSKVWAPIFTFVPMFGVFSLNFIGVELENPFGADDNDLPLDHFQTEMNKCLMMLLHEGADVVPGVSSSRCVKDFKNLSKTMRLSGMHQMYRPRSSIQAPRKLSRFDEYFDLSEDERPTYDKDRISQGTEGGDSMAGSNSIVKASRPVSLTPGSSLECSRKSLHRISDATKLKTKSRSDSYELKQSGTLKSQGTVISQSGHGAVLGDSYGQAISVGFRERPVECELRRGYSTTGDVVRFVPTDNSTPADNGTTDLGPLVFPSREDANDNGLTLEASEPVPSEKAMEELNTFIQLQSRPDSRPCSRWGVKTQKELSRVRTDDAANDGIIFSPEQEYSEPHSPNDLKSLQPHSPRDVVQPPSFPLESAMVDGAVQ